MRNEIPVKAYRYLFFISFVALVQIYISIERGAYDAYNDVQRLGMLLQTLVLEGCGVLSFIVTTIHSFRMLKNEKIEKENVSQIQEKGNTGTESEK